MSPILTVTLPSCTHGMLELHHFEFPTDLEPAEGTSEDLFGEVRFRIEPCDPRYPNAPSLQGRIPVKRLAGTLTWTSYLISDTAIVIETEGGDLSHPWHGVELGCFGFELLARHLTGQVRSVASLISQIAATDGELPDPDTELEVEDLETGNEETSIVLIESTETLTWEGDDHTHLIQVFDEARRDVTVPTKFGVCGRCEGRGSHVTTAIEPEGGGFTQSEWAEACDDDERFSAKYFGGTYDVPCHECDGLRVVSTLDLDRLDPDVRAALESWWDAEDSYADERSAERRMGA